MTHLVLSCLLSAAATPETVLVLELRSEAVAQSELAALTDIVTLLASRSPGVEIITSDDIERLLSLEAERQEIGCEASASCLAELADAFGTRRVIAGTVSQLGAQRLVTLTLLDTHTAAALKRTSARVDRMEVAEKQLTPAVAGLFGAPLPWRAIGFWSGTTVAAAGLIAATLGLVPLVGNQLGDLALKDESGRFAQDGDAARLTKMASLRQQIDRDRAAWNETGAPLFLTGLAAIAVGATVIAVTLPQDAE